MQEEEKVFLVGTHPYSYRVGEPAEVIGVAMITPPGDCKSRPCFCIRFEDGDKEYVPIIDEENYKLVTGEDARQEKALETVH